MPRKPRNMSLQSVPDAAGGALALRDRLMEKAGVDEAGQAKSLRASWDKLNAQLSSMKVTRFVVPIGQNRGSEVQTFEDADNTAQRAAAVELLSVVGAYPSKNVGHSGPSTVKVVLVIDPMREPSPRVKVIEVKPNPA